MQISEESFLKTIFVKRMEFDQSGHLIAVDFNDASALEAATFVLWFRENAFEQYKKAIKQGPPPPPERPGFTRISQP
jgi:hypothetical protein